jgi:transcriptional regulator with GAF, ATPase, and Fis domain
VIERAVIIASEGRLSLRDILPLNSFRPVQESGTFIASSGLRTKSELRDLERDTLVRALERAGWKVAGARGAARALGIPPSTLSSRMKALQIERPK